MRWRRETSDEHTQRMLEWRREFAWTPRQIDDEQVVWLEFYETRWVLRVHSRSSFTWYETEYRLIG
jgi:hypothetical protein